MTIYPTLRIIMTCLLLMAATAPLHAASTADLERRLDQQERRIDRLESDLEALQNQLYQQPIDVGSSRPANQSAVDPLVGVWDCTNNVFNYEISFFANGRLLQEEPSFSKVKSSRWSRTRQNQFVTQQGLTWSADFRNDDEVTITNLTDQASWTCYRKQ